MSPEFLRALLAAERHSTKVAPCIDCAEQSFDRVDPTVLAEDSSPPRCIFHSELAAGRSGIQLHHLGGRPSSLIVPVHANDHRRLSVLQDLAWRLDIEPGTPAATLVDILAMNAVANLATRADL